MSGGGKWDWPWKTEEMRSDDCLESRCLLIWLYDGGATSYYTVGYRIQE